MMRSFLAAAVAAGALFGLSIDASTLNPPVLPLIVRNPYLSTWLQDARGAPWERWPMFWTGQEVRTWDSSLPGFFGETGKPFMSLRGTDTVFA